MDVRAVLEELSLLPGVSGYEEPVAEAIRRRFEELKMEVRQDRFGNLIALRRGEGAEPRPKVMLAAHMDEIGLMVTGFADGGFLRFRPVGAVDPRVLPAQEVVVHGRRDLMGIIGAKPPHVQEAGEREKAYQLDQLYIDVGLTEEEARAAVRVGDVVTIHRPFVRLQGEYVAGKAFDDRAGVVAMLVCLEELGLRRHEADVLAVTTAQEEPGIRGSLPATFGVLPDVGIAIDVTFADESESGPRADLGKGPAIAIGPHVHPGLLDRFLEVAQDLRVPYQLDPAPSPGGTDAFNIQIARAGVPTILVSIPQRNMHTSVELLTCEDIRLTGRLLAGFIQSVDRGFTEGLLCF
ncbi:MAG: M42 family metallopeptidase [Chitinophagales bacterium]